MGGLYGVTLGGFFGGESMFNRRTDASKAAVMFPGREDATLVSTKGGALVPQQLKAGDAVYNTRGRGGVITGEVEGGRGLRRYTLRYDDQDSDEEDDEQPESELRAQPPRPDALAGEDVGTIIFSE